MKKKNFYLFVFLALVSFFFSFNLIYAQIPKLNFPGATEGASSIQAYIVNFYRFGLTIAGIFAVGMIVFGAIYYSLSGASPDKQSEAKDMITSAIWGVVLLFGSYLILTTINPNLVILGPPGQGSISCTIKDGPNPNPCRLNETPVYTGGNCSCYISLQTNCALQPTLPSCTTDQISPVDDKGNCICKPRATEAAGCPGVLTPLAPDPNNIPIYAWTTDVDIVKALNPTNKLPVDSNAWSYSNCPRKVKIKTDNTFYTVSCGSGFLGLGNDCSDYWSSGADSQEVIPTSTSKNLYTAGWLWPYYPKTAGPSQALCLLYAWYDSRTSELKKATLDGLKACTNFNTSTQSSIINLPEMKCPTCVDFPFQVDTVAVPFSPIRSPKMIPSKPISRVCNPLLTHSGKCGIDSNIKTKLTKLYDETKRTNEDGLAAQGDAWQDLEWEVTEAWPPMARHRDKCHYYGTCVDVALRKNVDCDHVYLFIEIAKNIFNLGSKTGSNQYGYAGNEYAACQGNIYDTTTGGHFHLK